MPVGMSGCTQCCEFSRARRSTFWYVRVGQLSLYSQLLLLPLGPSHADAGNAPHKVFLKTVECGGCSPPHVKMRHRTTGSQVTKCYPSVVRSMFRHFASFFHREG